MCSTNPQKQSWAENTADGWYLQTSPEHYRCHKIHIKQTNSERILATVVFKHHYITQPTVTPADILMSCIETTEEHRWNKRNGSAIKTGQTPQSDLT
jgi:hypothetical protein